MIDERMEIRYGKSVQWCLRGNVGWPVNRCYQQGTGKDSVLLSVSSYSSHVWHFAFCTGRD